MVSIPLDAKELLAVDVRIFDADKMNRTMMQRACQLQRLMAKPGYKGMLENKLDSNEKGSTVKKISLGAEMYEAIRAHLAQDDPNVVARDAWPFPTGAKVLHGWAIPRRSIRCGDVNVTVVGRENCVVARVRGKLQYGMVKQIYCLEDQDKLNQDVIVLSPIKNVFPKKLNVPTARFRYLLYLFKTVVGQVMTQEVLVVRPADVISVAAYRLLPRDTFGIPSEGIILIPAERAPLLDIDPTD